VSRSFLDAARQGRNPWWLYFLVIVAIASYWWFFSGFTADFYQSIFPSTPESRYISFFVAGYIPFIFVLGILIFAVEQLHRRRFCSLVNADAFIGTRRLMMGFGVWGLQLLIFTFMDLLARPQSYELTFDPKQWFPLLIFSLLLVPIQTSTEEFLFRGYLMQGLGLLTKHPLVLMLITSLAFAIPHFGNPEMERGFVWGALTYFTWGVFFAAITLKDQGLELSLGAHAANNLFSALVVNTPDSVNPTLAIFTYQSVIEARGEFFSLLVPMVIFYAIFFGGLPRKLEKSMVSLDDS
jgi:uncharacterized protein